MAEKVVPLTAEGKRKYEEELDHLITVRRPDVADKIHSAKEDGDISENAGYDAAKEEQAFVEGRIIDLSYGAAKVLGIVEEGVTFVRIEVEGFKDLDQFPYFVQVGSFEERSNALIMKESLSSRFEDVFVVESEGLYKVRVGACDTEEEARILAERLKRAGYDGFVAR